MAATAAPTINKVTVESDVQVIYCKIAAVADTNTTDFSNWSKNLIDVKAIASTTAAVGATFSAGTVTWKISSGTPDLLVRLAFN